MFQILLLLATLQVRLKTLRLCEIMLFIKS